MVKMIKRFLDCFCGMGGASEGFHKEGFECTGIDIIDVGYPYNLILKDMRELKGEDFRGYDVIWGSPPCNDFSTAGQANKTRKGRTPPKPERGLELILAFRDFVDAANPQIWLMENVSRATKFYMREKPMMYFWIGRYAKRALWSNCVFGLQNQIIPQRVLEKEYSKLKWKTQSQLKAKIPLACSLAFAKACREKLEKHNSCFYTK